VAAKPPVLLTKRQAAVAEEIRQGRANKQIAYALSIGENTVKVHVRNIMRKLNARNRTELAVKFGSLGPSSPKREIAWPSVMPKALRSRNGRTVTQ